MDVANVLQFIRFYNIIVHYHTVLVIYILYRLMNSFRDLKELLQINKILLHGINGIIATMNIISQYSFQIQLEH